MDLSFLFLVVLRICWDGTAASIFSSHLASLLRSSCNVLLSDETVRYAMVSSANSLTVDVMLSGMSLIYNTIHTLLFLITFFIRRSCV